MSDAWIRDLGQVPDGACKTIFDLLTDTIPKLFDALPVPIAGGSRMAGDKAATPNLLDLPQICEHYLGCSEDHLLALRLLMQPRPNTLQLPRFALYPLIRAVMESSGQVVWVLSPDDRRDRFRRLLQIQKAELDHDVGYVDALTRPRNDDTTTFRSFANDQRRTSARKRQLRWRRLLDAAAVVGVEQAEFEKGLTGGYQAVICQAADEQGLDRDFHGRQCGSSWAFVSGLAHPSMSRAWAGSINEPGEVGPDGTMFVRSEANPVVVRDMLSVAIFLHLRGLLLWNQACAAPPPMDIERDD